MDIRNYWITGDHHWGHFNIIKHGERPFNSLIEMNQVMIDRWNNVVKSNDIVYHLGDMFWTEKTANEILPILNGEIHLLIGNHDKNWKKVCRKLQRSPLNPSSNLIVEEKDIISIKEPIRAILCHYPMISWDGKSYNVWHFHGHTHQRIKSEGRRVNASIENTSYTPLNLEIFKNVESFEQLVLLPNE